MVAKIYTHCAECMGPLPDGGSNVDPFCSDECEGIVEDELGYGGNEYAAMALIQRYGPAAILPHLAGGNS